MFNSIGNKKKLKFITIHSSSASQQFSDEIVLQLENTKLIPLEVKVELLEMLAGYRFMTELISDSPDNIVEDFLKLIQIPFFKNSYFRKRQGETKFYSLFANEAIKEYFVTFERNIEPSELGLLYGYHPKSILAFMGLLEPTTYDPPKASYQLFNKKVMSKSFFQEEDTYHREKWKAITKLSPKIVAEADAYFIEFQGANPEED